MKSYRWLIYTCLATVVCFVLSYVTASIGGVAKDYPESVGKVYLKSGVFSAVTLPIKNFNRSINLSDIKYVVVESTNTDIEVAVVESDKISADLSIGAKEGEDLLSFEKLDSTLVIKVGKRSEDDIRFVVGDDSNQSRLVVKLPKAVRAAEVKTVSGEVRATRLDLEKLALTTVSGDVTIQKSKFNSVDFSTVSGELNLDGEFQRMTARSISGDMNLKPLNVSPEIMISTTSGDIATHVSTNPNLFVDFHTVSGDLNVSKNLTDKNIDDVRNFSLKLGDGKGRITVQSVSGDFSVN